MWIEFEYIMNQSMRCLDALGPFDFSKISGFYFFSFRYSDLV